MDIRVIAVMPLAIGQRIGSGVISGLCSQGMPMPIIICATEGVIHSQRMQLPDRFVGESRSRSLCIESVKHTGCDYVLSIDRDIVLTDKNAVADMVTALDAEPETGYVALWAERGNPPQSVYSDHVALKCCLFRSTVFSDLNFSAQHRGCTCLTVMRQAASIGYTGRYLDYKNRGYEIEMVN